MTSLRADRPITHRTVREIDAQAVGADDLAGLIAGNEPVVLRGLAQDWPLVAAGRRTPQAAAEYLLSFYNGRPAAGYTAPPAAGGRYFYDETLTKLAFDRERVQLDTYLGRMLAELGQADMPSYYVGSTDLDGYFPGFTSAGNDLALTDPCFARVVKSIWIGNRTTAAAHYDMSNNIACVAVGARRFTLFPPEQVANLYPGPLEPTPGGQVVSLVDFRDPDLARFPNFANAVEAAQVAELGPGDAVVYPALWWHHVEALADFNVMVNFWWNDAPAYLDSPMNTVLHGMLSLRDRPEPEKRAWAALFEYYLFGPADRPSAHLPEAARGPLGRLDETGARRLRAMLLSRLNR
ncbi:cupin-like domain-containing protein [Sphingomonas sp. UV9]|uniref:cupin-like domain-containing protein n=1 Tax=Sphingomonas sp. UV9 TaxID=1851410 RepID=UPI000FFB0A0D|nr:cupin-like domain-containing protein [Sphingomonas sp. UV9]RXD06648.1 cupin-like domain-containing protein [Sphingomonas sp. UV9]